MMLPIGQALLSSTLFEWIVEDTFYAFFIHCHVRKRTPNAFFRRNYYIHVKTRNSISYLPSLSYRLSFGFVWDPIFSYICSYHQYNYCSLRATVKSFFFFYWNTGTRCGWNTTHCYYKKINWRWTSRWESVSLQQFCVECSFPA